MSNPVDWKCTGEPTVQWLFRHGDTVQRLGDRAVPEVGAMISTSLLHRRVEPSLPFQLTYILSNLNSNLSKCLELRPNKEFSFALGRDEYFIAGII